MRFLKMLVGIALFPAGVAVTRSLIDVLFDLTGRTLQGVSASVWGLGIGFLLWLFAYGVMPRPMRTYILAHELTHALWGWAMGARILGIKVSRNSGYVRLTKTNFLITLAPYFFPLYTICILLLHVTLSFFFELRQYEPVWMGWIGLTWGFHLTFTLSTLRTHQPDIHEHGKLFSYAIIYLFNMFGVCVWIVTISTTAWSDWAVDIIRYLADSYTTVMDYAREFGIFFHTLLPNGT